MTEQIAGTPLWTAINAVPKQYPWLCKDETCEVVVVGAGVTGALCALRFAAAGISTVLLASGAVGYGSTSASMGVMEVDNGTGMDMLAGKIGMENAVRTFDLCAESLGEMESLTRSLPDDAGFSRRDLVLYTDCPDRTVPLQREYTLRHHTGFETELLQPSAAREEFSFPMQAALRGRGMAAEVDPYRLCHALVKAAEEAGARVYEHSRVHNISPGGEEHLLHCTTRHSVRAERVIIATGYDAAQFTGGLTGMCTVFSLATEPVVSFAGWPDRAVMRSEESHRVTLRTTSDDRILISGLDSMMVSPGSRLGGIFGHPALAAKKYAELECRLKSMFPGIRGMRGAYSYAATFADTADSLPLIGEDAEHPGWYFALCPGHNGILWAETASRLLLSLHGGSASPDLPLFSLTRADMISKIAAKIRG